MALTDRAAMSSATSGTGTITLGSALASGSVIFQTPGYDTFANSGCIDGQTYSYLILDTNGNWEYGRGTYTASGTTISRGPIRSSSGTSAISLSGNEQVFISLLQEDIREKLLAARTYYVRSDGSNSNTGLVDSAGGAFLTIQKAYDTIAANLDLGGQAVTIRLSKTGDTFTAGLNVNQPWTGGGSVTLQGFDSTPANSIISTTSANAINVTVPLPGQFLLRDFKVQTTTSGYCIYINAPGVVSFQNLNFGACAQDHMFTQAAGAGIMATGNYSISGGASDHMHAGAMGFIIVTGRTVTLTGTPAFSNAFCDATFSTIDASSNTYSGSATGPRYRVLGSASIYDAGAGATYFPGNSPGSGGTTTGNGFIV